VWGIKDGDLLVVLAIYFVTGHLSSPLNSQQIFIIPLKFDFDLFLCCYLGDETGRIRWVGHGAHMGERRGA
jgi:hypothetical protein